MALTLGEINGIKNVDEITEIIDLRNMDELQKLSKDIDIIIHFAANARVYDLIARPDLARDNMITTYNILEHCRKFGIKKLFSRPVGKFMATPI